MFCERNIDNLREVGRQPSTSFKALQKGTDMTATTLTSLLAWETHT